MCMTRISLYVCDIRLDIVRAFSHPERLCFTKELRETILDLSDHKLEKVNGCPRDMMLLISDALERAKDFAEWKIGRDEHDRAIRATIRRLYSWNSLRFVYPEEDHRWVSVAEAFRHACILRALRLLDHTMSAEEPEIQESVTAILDAAAEIDGDCCLIELMVLPLFMAGADCLSAHSRHYILLRFEEIKGRSGFVNAAPSDLLSKVWAERSRKPRSDHSNIPWMSFVSFAAITCFQESSLLTGQTHNPAIERQHDYLII